MKSELCVSLYYTMLYNLPFMFYSYFRIKKYTTAYMSIKQK